jgi:hypothetical protein
MNDKKREIKDNLAEITASIDQAQAMIDEARLKFKNVPAFQQQLDDQQLQLNFRKKQVEIMRKFVF